LFAASGFYSLQFVFQKLFEKRTAGGISVCLWNQVVFSTVAITFLLIKSGLPTELNWTAFWCIAGYVASAVICGIVAIKAMSCGPVAMVSTFCLIGGMIIPFFYGVLVLDENVGVGRWVAIGVLCLSCVAPMLFKNKDNKQSVTAKFFVLCMIYFITNGTVGMFQKMHQISPQAINEDSFVMFIAFFRLVVSLVGIFMISAVKKYKGEKNVIKNAFWEIGKNPMTPKMFLMIILFSAMNSISITVGDLFSLRCMVLMDASVQFPLLSAIILVFTAFFGRVIFSEKFNRETIATVSLAIVGILLYMI